MKEITIEQIKNDLETAAYVERILPKVKVQGYQCFGKLFPIKYTEQEIAFMEKLPIKVKPTQEQITIWETVVLQWLPLLNPEESRLVWKRANRFPWKMLCREFCLCRTRLMIKYDKAIIKIEFYLKGQQKCRVQKRSGHFCKKSL